jgi:hypothetical protein
MTNVQRQPRRASGFSTTFGFGRLGLPSRGEALANPDLDERLPGNAKPVGFQVQPREHPLREIDIDPFTA